MRLAKIEHERCDEYAASTYVWVPEDMDDAAFYDAVAKAKTAYQEFINTWEEGVPPNSAGPHTRPPYEEYPDLTVKEVKEKHDALRAVYKAWEKGRDQARKPFAWYLSQQGLKEFWEHQPELTTTIYWGHQHRAPIDYSETDVGAKDLAGPMQPNEL